jgi:hypothetical protein
MIRLSFQGIQHRLASANAANPLLSRFAVNHVSGLFCNGGAKYAHPERPKDVRVKVRFDLLRLQLFDRAEIAVTSVAQDDVQTLKMSSGLLDRCEDSIAVRDIERQGEYSITVRHDELIEITCLPCCGDNLIAALQSCLCPNTAKTSRCTSDEPNF